MRSLKETVVDWKVEVEKKDTVFEVGYQRRREIEVCVCGRKNKRE